MAIILKNGKTFEDKFGNVYEDAYGVVDQCNGNKKDKLQYVVLEIYKDVEARAAKKVPIAQFNYTIRGADFDTFFSAGALEASTDQYEKAYAYILQVTKVIGTEVDEETGESIDITELVWPDWQSDE